MPESTKPVTKPPQSALSLSWWLALICSAVCLFLMVFQLQTIFLLSQHGIVTQSTIVALAPCSIPNRQPNSSVSQQGMLLTIRFLDTHNKRETVNFPGCQSGVYHMGDLFPVRYLATDPTTIVQSSSALALPEGTSLALTFLSVIMLLSLAIVAVGASRFIERKKYHRLFREHRRRALSRKKVP